MPFEFSPPKKSTIVVSMALEVLGIVIGVFGALDMFIPFLSSIGVDPAWNVDGICVITGLVLTGVAWFIFFLGVKLRGV